MPQSGLPALVRSVSAYRQGDYYQAGKLHALACSEARKLPANLRIAARAMGEGWLFDRLKESFSGVKNTTDFDSAYAQLEAVMATPGTSESLIASLRSMNKQVLAWRKRLPQGEPHRQANKPTMQDYWNSILDDPQSSEEERENAQRALQKLTR